MNSNMKRRLKGERPRWNRFQHYFPSNEFVESGILKWGIICHHTENFSGERKTDRKEILTDNPRKAFFSVEVEHFLGEKRNNKKLEKHSGDFNKVREMKKSRGGEKRREGTLHFAAPRISSISVNINVFPWKISRN